MRKLLCALLFLAPIARAQTVTIVPINENGIATIAARNTSLANFAGTTNPTEFLMQSPFPGYSAVNLSLYTFGNSTSHNISIVMRCLLDPSVKAGDVLNVANAALIPYSLSSAASLSSTTLGSSPLGAASYGAAQAATLPVSGSIIASTGPLACVAVIAEFSSVTNLSAGPTDTVGISVTFTAGAATSGQIPTSGGAAPGSNGGAASPVLIGSLGPAANGNGASTVGIDTFNNGVANVTLGGAGTVTVATGPSPAKSGELGILFEGVIPDLGTTALVAPWTPLTGGQGNECSGVSPQNCVATIANISSGQVVQRTFTNPNQTGFDIASVITVQGSNPVARGASQGSNGCAATPCLTTYAASPLSGSLMLGFLLCQGAGTTCGITSVTDSQSNTWQPLTVLTVLDSAKNWHSLHVYYAPKLSTGVGNTVTWNFSTGTPNGTQVIEVTGVSPAAINQPVVTNQEDAAGNTIVTLDAPGLNRWICTVTLSTNTTTQCPIVANGVQLSNTNTGATGSLTVNGVPARLYVTDIQLNTTTAAGAGSSIQFVTGIASACAGLTTSLSAILYPNTATGLTSIMGARTPLVAPIQNSICAKQAGGVAGTTVIELRGFIAP